MAALAEDCFGYMRIRSEIERLRADFNDCNANRAHWRSEAERLRAENEKLQRDFALLNRRLEFKDGEIGRLRASLEDAGLVIVIPIESQGETK